MKNEAVIRMYLNPPILTVEEYEKMQQEVIATMMADPDSPMAKMVGYMLTDHEFRYVEAWEQNSGKDHPIRLTSQENEVL